MPSKFQSESARRGVVAGFPCKDKFLTPESLAAYFGGSQITCLQCGKCYRTLGVHLKTIHGMEPDEYREIYGIPWTYGLSCAESSQRHSDIAKENYETGKWVASAEQAKIARGSLSNQKKRQPVRDVLTHRNLDKLNANKTGEDKKRRLLQPKRGTPEWTEKMRTRPQCEKAKEMLRTYWIGREQTNEHVLNRTGFNKRFSNG